MSQMGMGVSRFRFRRLVALVGVLVLSGVAPAVASLVFDEGVTLSGQGLGAVFTVLTLQTNQTTGEGCVEWTGAADSYGPCTNPSFTGGDELESQSQTRTLGEAGIDSADNIAIVFNGSESDDDAVLEELILTLFAPDGSVLFTSGSLTGAPLLFDVGGGTGASGFVFRLDESQAASAQAAIDTFVGGGGTLANIRAGLAAELSDLSDGNETFALASFQNVNLTITKDDDVDPISAGGTVTYTIVVTNEGPDAAESVSVTDTLPSDVTNVSASSSPQGSCTVNGTTSVTCSLGTIASADSVTITIEVTDDGPGDRVMTNTASVSTTTNEPDTSDNTAVETTTIGSPATVDVSISKTDSPDEPDNDNPVLVNTQFSYTLTVSNDGQTDATGVIIVDTLPSGVSVVNPLPAGCVSNGMTPPTITCTVGDLDAGDPDASFTINVRSSTTGLKTNTATVSTNETNVSEDTSDSESTLIVAPAPAEPIPTVSEWGLLMMIALLAGVSWIRLRP